MDKAQAIQSFWENFGLPAYDEQTVPKDAEMPYITYSVTTDSLDKVVNLSGSVWYRSSRWKEVSQKADEIAQAIGERGFLIKKIDGMGYVWFVKGTPFAQRLSDPDDDMIRRIYINIQAEFLTAY